MMKKLEKTFKGRGEVKHYTFSQIQENKTSYVYKVTPPYNAPPHYEVFRKKIFTGFGNEKETYPTSNAFGVYAWWTREKEGIKPLVERIEQLDELAVK